MVGQREPGSGIEVVALIASSGGLDAVSTVLAALPVDMAAAVVVQLHLSGQGSLLVPILQRRIGLDVGWVDDGARLEQGRVVVARPRRSLEILPDGSWAVGPAEVDARDRPHDVLLTSLADSYGPRALAVVLTGMGSDGAAGVRMLKEAGGVVLAQSAETSEHPAMPKAAAEAGADLRLPLHQIGPVVADVVRGAPLPRADEELTAISATFGDDGEIATLARDIDWSTHRLGPVHRWSPVLRSLLRLAGDSPMPMTVLWGDELIQFYGDAGISANHDHPRVFGVPVAEAYPELPAMHDTIRTALAGETVSFADVLVSTLRSGRLQHSWFDVVYTPVREVDATIGGVLAVWNDRTDAFLAARRLETLNRLSTVPAAASRVAAAEQTLAVLSEAADVAFAAVYGFDAGRSRATLMQAVGVPSGSTLTPHVVPLTPSGDWPLQQLRDAGRPVLVDDMALRFRGHLVGPEQTSPERALLFPLRDEAEQQVVGALLLGAVPELPFDERYREFLAVVGETVSSKMAESHARQREIARMQQLKELDRAKTEFFSNVSHEFRTPLTLILAPLEEALQRRSELPIAVAAELEVAQRNAQRLLRLVGTLLDFSQVEASRLRAQFVATDLAALTTEIASMFRSAAEAAGLDLVVDAAQLAEPVWIDPEMWEIVVSNLLSNALKFTLDGEITVTLRALPKHAELVVRDTGVGIPEEELPHIFKRFHRVRGAAGRTDEGAGIGLALVDELVRRHHGRIRATSTKGEGTAFTVWVPLGRRSANDAGATAPRSAGLPVATAMAREAMQWGQPSAPLRQPSDGTLGQPVGDYSPSARILVADDNPDMRDYLTQLLAPHWRVEVAADGARALESARENPPDLVLADVMMPGLDGFALLRALRQEPELASIPVVLVTARAGEESAIEGLLAGADDYIVKPFSARELVARVGGQLVLARSRRRTSDLNEFLVGFSDAVRPLTDAAEVSRIACSMIRDRLGADRAYWSEADWASREWVATGESARSGVRAIEGRHRMDTWDTLTPTLLDGVPVVVNDAQADPRLPTPVKEACAEQEMAAIIAVPVLVERGLRCVLAIDTREPRRWSADDVTLVEGVAVRCWGEVERARAEAAVRVSEERQRFLLGLNDALEPLTTADDIKSVGARHIGQRLGVNRAFYAEIAGDDWIVGAGFESDVAPLPEGTYPAAEYGRWTMDTLRAGGVVAVGDTQSDSRLSPGERAALASIHVAAVLGVPLVRDGEIVAVLSTHNRTPHEWTDDEITLVRETAARTWPWVERARVQEELRESQAKYQRLLASVGRDHRSVVGDDESAAD
jgi:signal transduction histidine kinase/chemotaxis response regulator CheB